ncbi:MAG: ComF family protein [Deltaproteobacteria bacterium]|nr:ComF family protein [Deltaproteobacteria bacterium]
MASLQSAPGFSRGVASGFTAGLFRMHLLCFPPCCQGCSRMMEPLSGLFSDAHRGFPYLCPSCHDSLGSLASGTRAGADQPGGFPDRVWSALEYAPPLDRWIPRFKYSRQDTLAGMLAHLLAQAPFGAEPLAGADLVVPVPLHGKRLASRGFNQSLLLAHHWLREWAVRGVSVPPIEPGLLVRHRHTAPQVTMEYRERLSNVDGAFSIGVLPRLGLENRRILLVDDVMTTGATLENCVRVLKNAGAARVEALVLARSLKDHPPAGHTAGVQPPIQEAGP